MIAVHARAPLRLGLAGGGTDVSPYSDIHGGRVLNATISLSTHCHISIRHDERVVLQADDFGESVELAAGALPDLDGELLLHKAVYRRIVTQFLQGRPMPVTVTTYSDAPPGSGVGSSSALVVAMSDVSKLDGVAKRESTDIVQKSRDS